MWRRKAEEDSQRSEKLYLGNLHFLFPLILIVCKFIQQQVRVHSSSCLWFIILEHKTWTTTSPISAVVEEL